MGHMRTSGRATPVASVVLGLALLAACSQTSSSTDPSTTPAASATPTGTSAATDTPPSTTQDPGSTADPSIGQAGDLAWARTDTFAADPGTTYVTDVTAWDGGFAAIGSAWAGVNVVGVESPALWTSADGTSWEQRPIDLGVEDLTLVGIASRAAGAELLLAGRTPGGNAGTIDAGPPESFLWSSTDGITWTEEPTPLAAGALIGSFDHGAAGYALVADGDIWHSPDGVAWTRTRGEQDAAQVIAGDEGFVATLAEAGTAGVSALASADGMTWFDADPIGMTMLSVAALRGDWLATAWADDGDIVLWRSANGLQWTQALGVNDLTGPDGPKTRRGLEYDSISGAVLAGGAGHAFLTLTHNHCCAQRPWNHGVWTSTDGTSWTPVAAGAVTDVDPAGALVASVAMDGSGTVVLGGHIGRGEDAAFWVGER